VQDSRTWMVGLLLIGLVGCAGERKPSSGRADDHLSRTRATRISILRAEDRGIIDADLRAALEAEDAFVRARAVRAVGRIGGTGAATWIGTAVDDPAAAVRAEANFALARLARDSGTPFTPSTADPEPLVRQRVAGAIALLPDSASQDRLIALLGDSDPRVIRAAVYSAARQSDANRLAPILLEIAESGDREARMAALHALSAYGARRESLEFELWYKVRGKLVELTKSNSALVRLLAARGLRIPTTEHEAANLGLLTEDPVAEVRIEAVRSFSFVGAPVEPFLKKTIDDDDARVALATLQGFGRMRGADVVNELLAVIVDVTDRPLWMRERAILALGKADQRYAAQAANGISVDEEPRIRAAVARALTGVDEDNAFELLESLSNDEEAAVRLNAIVGLGGAPQPLAEQFVERLVGADSATIAAMARAAGTRLRMSGRQADSEATLDFLERLGQAESGRDSWSEGAILESWALAGAGPRSREALEGWARGADPRLQEMANSQLRRLFGPEAGLEATGPGEPAGSYKKILKWAASSRAAIVTVERPGFTPGRFTILLDTENTPLTAWRFAQAAAAGRYDDGPIERVSPNVLVRFGERRDDSDPTSMRLPDEIHPIRFVPGTVGMVSSGNDRGRGLWFVTLTQQPHFDGDYTAFGHVVQNLTGVTGMLLPGDRIVAVEVYQGDGTEPLPTL